MDPLNIIIVEDNPEYNRFLCDLLTLEGHQVVSAPHGLDATKIIENNQIDLVITDLLMPKKDGVRLITELRISHPKLPIIAMSGGESEYSPSFLESAKALGAAQIIDKPFTKDKLIDLIDICFE